VGEGGVRDLVLQYLGVMCSDGNYVEVMWNSVFFVTTSFLISSVDLWAGGMGTSSEFAPLVGGGERLPVCLYGRVGIIGFVACG
jgi:hypothetical protein